MNNVIYWSKRVNVDARAAGLRTQSAWYDHAYYEVPFRSMPSDLNRLKSALHARLYSASYGKFGGGTSVGDVTVTDYDPMLRRGTLRVECIYHIGD